MYKIPLGCLEPRAGCWCTMQRSISWRAFGFGVAVGMLFLVERLRPLRARKERGAARVARNLAIAFLAGATTAASQSPIITPVLRRVERGRLGLLRRVPLPRVLRAVIGFLLLDYTLYVWHWLNHRSAFLWRFHAVHHVDLDLDCTTGLRFHFGELALAAGFRAAQVLFLGVDDATLRMWQQLLVLSVIFHHSNVELPIGVERRLGLFITTPRMHGIHHSTRREDVGSNYTSLLSCWDRLHATLRVHVPQSTVTIGVDGFQRAQDVTLGRSLTLPFRGDPRLRAAGLSQGVSRSAAAEGRLKAVPDR